MLLAACIEAQQPFVSDNTSITRAPPKGFDALFCGVEPWGGAEPRPDGG